MFLKSTKIKFIAVIACFFFVSMSSIAQVTLPYYTGFDDETQQAGWEQYEIEEISFSNWSFGGLGSSYSAPNSILHDYSPGTQITLLDNWFVSPGFLIETGGNIDSLRFRNAGLSVPEVGDTIGLYLLNGSQDPELADSIILLVDFRGEDFPSDTDYHLKTNIPLPASTDSSYLAIRYRNNDSNSKWLTVSFDNIAISGNPAVGINRLNSSLSGISVYPNPAPGNFQIDTERKISSIKIYSASGALVYSRFDVEANSEITLSDYKAGVYFIKYKIGTESNIKKVIVI